MIFIKKNTLKFQIKSSNKENFIIPNEVKNDNYNFKILNHEKDDFQKLKSKNIEIKKDKVNTYKI